MRLHETINPEDFIGLDPPERIIGSECEYDIQSPRGIKKSEYISPRALGSLGVTAFGYEDAEKAHYYLSNGGKIYEDVEHIEYATPEARGPRQAAAADMAGALLVAAMVEQTELPHNGVYRSAGSYLEGINYFKEATVGEVTRGYHENYLIPRHITHEGLIDQVIPTYLASRIWAMSGMLRDTFTLSQKVWGIGGDPVAHKRDRLVKNGQKPMCIIPPQTSEGDITRDPHWARLEVRFADPTQSPTTRFLSFAATSLVLRMIEHDYIVGKDLQKLATDEPLEAAYSFGSDLTLQHTIKMQDGSTMRALDIQQSLAELAAELSREIDLPEDELEAIELWIDICEKLRKTNPEAAEYEDAITEIEFAARHFYLARKNGSPKINYDDELARRNLIWDRITPEGTSGKWWQRFPSPHIDQEEIERLTIRPPQDTRARWRAEQVLTHDYFDEISWTVARPAGNKDHPSYYRTNPYQTR